ncbi:MAG: Crp/Fnr family transcriptional regulator [Betaproteobacteria bacterium]
MSKSPAAIPNIILAALPAREFQKLRPALSEVTLNFADVLYEFGEPIADVYFPSACLVSLLTRADGHVALEVGMVGREGIVGIPLALGMQRSPVKALVQGGGPALRMKKTKFLAALEGSVGLKRGIYAYIYALMGQISQTAVCNRFHLVEARLARWLLMTRDRVERAEFRMTHEFLSHMLGVRREGVSEAASAFQHQHLIEYNRGKIRILDHRGLEAAACSCYHRSPVDKDAIKPWRSGPH